MDEDLKGLEAETGGPADEPQSGPWDKDWPIYNIVRWIGLWIILLIVTFIQPLLQWPCIIVCVLVGLFFGVKWLWKGILQQKVRPFSRESGFYWLLLSIGTAFVIFLIGRFTGQ